MTHFRAPRGTSRAISDRLLPWFHENARVLPWRENRDPYAVWVSEAMLQQTRVETVVPYFTRWMDKYPTPSRLAAAPLEEVLKSWEGLGYYARARNLHRAANVLVRKHNGRVPGSPDDLAALPGVGPYTTAAVASLAFGHPLPVLDGNVERVLTRLCAVDAPVDAPAVKRGLRELAGRLMKGNPPGAFNESMMELGARICLPRAPRCGVCPLAGVCKAFRAGKPEAFPVKRPKKKIPVVEVGGAVIWREPGVFLVAKRHDKGLLGGMWEFPGGKQEPGESLQACVHREIQEELGLDVEVRNLLVHVRHTYTHFHLSLHIFHCRWRGDAPRALDCADWRWTTLEGCRPLPFGMADRKVLEAMAKHPGSRAGIH